MNEVGASLEAESIVLGAIFLEPTIIKQLVVVPEYFNARNKQIFKKLLEMDQLEIPIEIAAVVEYIGSENLDSIGGFAYLIEVASSAPTTTNLGYYENVIVENHKRKRLGEIGMKMVQGMDADEARRELDKITDISTTKHDGNIRAGLQRVYSRILSNEGGYTGIPSGFKDLDDLTQGFQRKDLIILAARPSVGKTAFAADVALNVVSSVLNQFKGAEVGFFSAEMGEEQIEERMISNVARIDSRKLKTALKSFTKNDWEKTGQAVDALYNSDMKIFDESPMYLDYVWRNALEMRRNNPDGDIMIMIDYLQLLRVQGRFSSRREEIEEISRSLKSLAKKINAPVIALSQLSRKVEERQDKRPMMSDLREAGGIEQDADVIAFLYREDYYDQETEDRNIIEVIIAKQRNGPTGTVKLGYLKELSKFTTIDWGTQ